MVEHPTRFAYFIVVPHTGKYNRYKAVVRELMFAPDHYPNHDIAVARFYGRTVELVSKTAEAHIVREYGKVCADPLRTKSQAV